MIKNLKPFAALCVAAGLAFGLAGCGDKKTETAPAAKADKTLVIGVSPVPGGDMMNFLKPKFAEKGVNLKVVEFSDYVQPNMALSDKSLDANFFQHKPYLDDFVKQHNLKLVSYVPVFIAPIAIYSKTLKKPSDIAEGATVSIPNDPTNGGRALILLHQQGLIKLDNPKNLFVTPANIVENPKKLKIVEVEAAQLPRSLDDVALAVINCNFALGADLNPVKDSIAIEAKDSPYANIVAIRAGDENSPELKVLKDLITSPEMRQFINEKFKGSLVPVF